MLKRDDTLDRTILFLSDSDPLRLRDLVEGTLITGAPGAGKTSCSGRQIAMGLLRTPNMGGLVLTAKAEETQNWIGYAKACGREKDLIVFNAESGDCFDPLHYEFTRPGRGAGDMESIIDLFSTLVSIGKKEVGHGHDPFGKGATNNLFETLQSCSNLPADTSLSPPLTGALNRCPRAQENSRKRHGRRSRIAPCSSPPSRTAKTR